MRSNEKALLKQAEFGLPCQKSLENLETLMHVQRGINALGKSALQTSLEALEKGMDAASLRCASALILPTGSGQLAAGLCVVGSQAVKHLVKGLNTDTLSEKISPDVIKKDLQSCQVFYEQRLAQTPVGEKAPLIAEIRRFEKRLSEFNWENSFIGTALELEKYKNPFTKLANEQEAQEEAYLHAQLNNIKQKDGSPVEQTIKKLSTDLRQFSKTIHQNTLSQKSLEAQQKLLTDEIKHLAHQEEQNLNNQSTEILNQSDLEVLSKQFQALGLEVSPELKKLSGFKQALLKITAKEIHLQKCQKIAETFQDYQTFGNSLNTMGQITGSDSLTKIGTGISSIASIGSSIATLSAGTATLGPIGAIVSGCFVLSTLFGKKKEDGLGHALKGLSTQIQSMHTEMRNLFSESFKNQQCMVNNQVIIIKNQQGIISNQGIIIENQKGLFLNQNKILEAIKNSHMSLSELVNFSYGAMLYAQEVLTQQQSGLQNTANRIFHSLQNNHHEMRGLILALFPQLDGVQETILEKFFMQNLNGLSKKLLETKELAAAVNQDRQLEYAKYRDVLIEILVALKNLETNSSLSGEINFEIDETEKWNRALPLLSRANDFNRVPLRSLKHLTQHRFHLPLTEEHLLNFPLWQVGMHTYLNWIQTFRTNLGKIEHYGEIEKYEEAFELGQRVARYSREVVSLPENNELHLFLKNTKLVHFANTFFTEQENAFLNKKYLFLQETLHNTFSFLRTELMKENLDSIKILKNELLLWADIEASVDLLPAMCEFLNNYKGGNKGLNSEEYEKTLGHKIEDFSNRIPDFLRLNENNLAALFFAPNVPTITRRYIIYRNYIYMEILNEERKAKQEHEKPLLNVNLKSLNLEESSNKKDLDTFVFKFYRVFGNEAEFKVTEPLEKSFINFSSPTFMDKMRESYKASQTQTGKMSHEKMDKRNEALSHHIKKTQTIWLDTYHKNLPSIKDPLLSALKGFTETVMYAGQQCSSIMKPLARSNQKDFAKSLLIPFNFSEKLFCLSLVNNAKIMGHYLYAERLGLGNIELHYSVEEDQKKLRIDAFFRGKDFDLLISNVHFLLDTWSQYQSPEENVLLFWYGGECVYANDLCNETFDNSSDYFKRSVKLHIQELCFILQPSVEGKMPLSVEFTALKPEFSQILYRAHLRFHKEKLHYTYSQLMLPSSPFGKVFEELDLRYKLAQSLLALTNSINSENQVLFEKVNLPSNLSLKNLLDSKKVSMLHKKGYFQFFSNLILKLDDLPFDNSIPCLKDLLLSENHAFCSLFDKWGGLAKGQTPFFQEFDSALRIIETRIICIDQQTKTILSSTHQEKTSGISLQKQKLLAKMNELANEMKFIFSGKPCERLAEENENGKQILENLHILSEAFTVAHSTGELKNSYKLLTKLARQLQLLASTDTNLNWEILKTHRKMLEKLEQKVTQFSDNPNLLWRAQKPSDCELGEIIRRKKDFSPE